MRAVEPPRHFYTCADDACDEPATRRGHRAVLGSPTGNVTGATIPIGVGEDGFTVLLDLIEPDPAFPAFWHCPLLGF